MGFNELFRKLKTVKAFIAKLHALGNLCAWPAEAENGGYAVTNEIDEVELQKTGGGELPGEVAAQAADESDCKELVRRANSLRWMIINQLQREQALKVYENLNKQKL